MRLIALVILFISTFSTAWAVDVEVTVDVKDSPSFVEFKVESDQKGEKASGHLKKGEKFDRKFEMGNWNQNIWFWWDTLNGTAEISIKVDGVVVFKGTCTSQGNGEKSVIKTAVAEHFEMAQKDPYLQPKGGDSSIVHIKKR